MSRTEYIQALERMIQGDGQNEGEDRTHQSILRRQDEKPFLWIHERYQRRDALRTQFRIHVPKEEV